MDKIFTNWTGNVWTLTLLPTAFSAFFNYGGGGGGGILARTPENTVRIV